jgi:hypothetical protein
MTCQAIWYAMVAVVVCVSSVGGSPMMAAFRMPPLRGASCAVAGGALTRSTSEISIAVRTSIERHLVIWGLLSGL